MEFYFQKIKIKIRRKPALVNSLHGGDLHLDFHGAFERAAIIAAHRRDIGVITAMPDLHISAVNLTVVRRIERTPTRAGE